MTRKIPKWLAKLTPPQLFNRREIARLHRHVAGTGEKIYVRVLRTKTERYDNPLVVVRYYVVEYVNVHPNMQDEWTIEQRHLTKLTKTEKGN